MTQTKIKTRFNAGDRVQLVTTMKAEAITAQGYPPKGTGALVRECTEQTAEVQWDVGDPAVQNVAVNDLIHEHKIRKPAFKPYEAHEYADKFPMIDGEAFIEFRQDILLNGLKEPGWLFEGKLLDGRNRQKACLELGFEFETRPFEGTQAEALAFVISLNIKRRHLGVSTLTKIALSFEKIIEQLTQEAKERQKTKAKSKKSKAVEEQESQLIPPVAQAKDGSVNGALAKMVGVSKSSVTDAKKIQRDEPDLFNQIGEDLSISQAKTIAMAPKKEKAKAIVDLKKGKKGSDVLSDIKPKIKSRVHPATQGVSKDSDKQNTADETIVLLLELLNEIDLDVCSNDGKPNIPAKNHFRLKDNALKQIWFGKKLFMNPPFSELKAFAEKWIEHFTIGEGEEGVVLAKLDSRISWFWRLMETCDCFAMHRGYYSFKGNDNSAVFSVCYFYYGPNVEAFMDTFGKVAACFPLDNQEIIEINDPNTIEVQAETVEPEAAIAPSEVEIDPDEIEAGDMVKPAWEAGEGRYGIVKMRSKKKAQVEWVIGHGKGTGTIAIDQLIKLSQVEINDVNDMLEPNIEQDEEIVSGDQIEVLESFLRAGEKPPVVGTIKRIYKNGSYRVNFSQGRKGTETLTKDTFRKVV